MTTPSKTARTLRTATSTTPLLLAWLVVSGSAGAADWSIEVNAASSGKPLPVALLGHYDLSGEMFAYDQEPGLVDAMTAVGFSDWRIGVGRWEASTWLLPELSDGTTMCPIVIPESSAPPGADDLALIAARDWFNDDGFDVELPDTLDDTRYELGYLRAVLDVVDAFGATPFVSIDSMPLALSASETPWRPDCAWTFRNQVTNVRPEDPAVLAAAVAGLVERVVEGDGNGAARPVEYWEIWNEPEFPNFWDPSFETPPGSLNSFFEMSIRALLALDAYRSASVHPNASGLRFGLGSFAIPAVAAATLSSFDSQPLLPGGFVPLDFLSFHSYSDDPLDVVAAIETVAAAALATTNYTDVELALAEWGPHLMNSSGDPVYAASIQPALHIATVIALGAAAGLDRAHRAIFWDFYPNSVRLGLLDHDMNPRSAYRAYELLSRGIENGAVRIPPNLQPDGRLDGGNGAVLVSRSTAGVIRALFVNRNLTDRTARIDLGLGGATPARLWVYADSSGDIVEVPATGPDFVVPAEALVMAEFAAAVPSVGTKGAGLLCLLLAVTYFAAHRTRR
jgi:hypothetical protein